MMCFGLAVFSVVIVTVFVSFFMSVIVSMAMTVTVGFLRCFGSGSTVSIWEKASSSFRSPVLNLSYSPWCNRLGSLFFQSSRWKKALLTATTLAFDFHRGSVVLSIRFFTSDDARLPTNSTCPTAHEIKETPAATPQNGTLGGTTLTTAGMVAIYNRFNGYFETGNEAE